MTINLNRMVGMYCLDPYNNAQLVAVEKQCPNIEKHTFDLLPSRKTVVWAGISDSNILAVRVLFTSSLKRSRIAPISKICNRQ